MTQMTCVHERERICHILYSFFKKNAKSKQMVIPSYIIIIIIIPLSHTHILG